MRFPGISTMKTVAGIAMLATGLFGAASAQAQGRLSLSERVQRLEQQAQGQGGGQTVELLNRISELQTEVQNLRGQVEQQSFEIENLKKALHDRYLDLDSRLNRLEGNPQASAASTAPELEPSAPIAPGQLQTLPTEAQAPGQLTTEEPELANPAVSDPASGIMPVQSEKVVYDEAFTALREGRYAESARKFEVFLGQYPNGEFSDNATYWLGESHYVTQNYHAALATFKSLLRKSPQSPKAADALLKLGYCYYELKEWEKAQAALNEVVRSYPDSTVARLAQGRLRALPQEAAN